MTDYRNAQAKDGTKGIAACADAYLACYANDGDSLWQVIRRNAESECVKSVYNLDPAA
jgi:hypothetical protein